VQLNVGELAGRIALLVWNDLDGKHGESLSARLADVRPGWRGSRYNVGSPLDRPTDG
jgi:hypothetical protein